MGELTLSTEAGVVLSAENNFQIGFDLSHPVLLFEIRTARLVGEPRFGSESRRLVAVIDGISEKKQALNDVHQAVHGRAALHIGLLRLASLTDALRSNHQPVTA